MNFSTCRRSGRRSGGTRRSTRKQLAHVLLVACLRQRREPDQVTEEHAGDPARGQRTARQDRWPTAAGRWAAPHAGRSGLRGPARRGSWAAGGPRRRRRRGRTGRRQGARWRRLGQAVIRPPPCSGTRGSGCQSDGRVAATTLERRTAGGRRSPLPRAVRRRRGLVQNRSASRTLSVPSARHQQRCRRPNQGVATPSQALSPSPPRPSVAAICPPTAARARRGVREGGASFAWVASWCAERPVRGDRGRGVHSDEHAGPPGAVAGWPRRRRREGVKTEQQETRTAAATRPPGTSPASAPTRPPPAAGDDASQAEQVEPDPTP